MSDFLRRLISAPKRLCDKAADRAFERQLRQFQEKFYAEQKLQFEAFQRQIHEQWVEMLERALEQVE